MTCKVVAHVENKHRRLAAKNQGEVLDNHETGPRPFVRWSHGHILLFDRARTDYLFQRL